MEYEAMWDLEDRGYKMLWHLSERAKSRTPPLKDEPTNERQKEREKKSGGE